MKKISKLALGIAILSGFFASTRAHAEVIDTDWINLEQTMCYSVYLHAGQHMAYGVAADNDALDVDLHVVAPSGDCLTSDTLEDAEPVVEFVVPYSGYYVIQVKLISSIQDVPCLFQFIRF